MKICNRCGIEKEFDEFNKRTKSKDGYNAFCKECNKQYLKEHYTQNKQYYVDKAKVNQNKIVEYVRQLKNVPCLDCKISYPHYTMDFDHLVGKEFNISKMVRVLGLNKLLNEIAKCEIVCANCHRERTYQRGLLGNRRIGKVASL